MPKITPEHWTTLEKIFVMDDWRFDRQEGSRRSYVKPGIARPIVIPTYRNVNHPQPHENREHES